MMESFELRCWRDGKPIIVTVTPPDPEEVQRMIAAIATRPTRFTLLKNMADSPLMYLIEAYRALDEQEEGLAEKLGAGVGRPKDVARRIGTAVHHIVLGSPGSVVVYTPEQAEAYAPEKPEPKTKRKGKIVTNALLEPDEPIEKVEKKAVRNGKAWQAFAADHGDKTILIPSEYEQAMAMANHLRSSPEACRLLFEDTLLEERITWILNGLTITSTPDSRKPRKRVVDLKSCADNRSKQFERQIFNMLYHSQLECYAQASEYEDGVRPEEAHLVAVDRKRPPRIYTLDGRALELGAKCLGRWTEDLRIAFASDNFPHDVMHIVTPPDYMTEVDMTGVPDEEEEQQ